MRHRGTIGGSISHADPASDLPATTLALGATYVAQGPNGTREIAAADFYEAFLTNTLADDELLTEIRVPKMQGAGWSFQKFNRRAQDWAIVGVAAWRRNGDAGVGLVNMGSTPILATSVASALAGGASVEDAAEQAVAEADPQADLNASVEYRTHLAKVLTRRALEAAGELSIPQPLLQRLVGAAVDVDLGAGEELRLLAAQEGDDGAEVVGVAHPHVLGAPARVQRLDPLRPVRAGLHRVDGDALLGDLAGQRLQEARSHRRAPCSTGSGWASAGAPTAT